MAITKLSIGEFLALPATVPILDVRSPGEYTHAHIPGAYSFPVFSNEERKIIGTAYKQESREKAIKIGLEFFGRNMARMVEEAEKIISQIKGAGKEVGVHCWRGGMRSSAMAWLLDLYGFKVYLLNGGYKSYRRLVLAQFERSYDLRIVGGCTGSNKTGIIQRLNSLGETAIDLEALAIHKGSAFGNLDRLEQPSQEQFENILGMALYTSGDKTIWLEGESQRIGLLNIPFSFYQNMRSSLLFFIDIPFEKRLAYILKDYGVYEKEKLINAIVRIKKKLGGLETKNAVNALLEDDTETCFGILLKYYDKLYLKSTLKNNDDPERQITYITCDSTDARSNTQQLLEHIHHGKN